MVLGAFSISLNVKDIKTSRDFYETLGFKQFGGDPEQNYLILKNGDTIIGLFQNMFEENLLTFNPDWDQNANTLTNFNDIREIQKVLKNKNYTLINEADGSTKGPANFMVKDPDGNIILFDQHV